MPEQETLERAERDKEEGKAPSTQAGAFVREEMHHIREGKHGARSSRQAVAIGLSKARKAGVKLPGGRKKVTRSRRPQNKPSARRSQAIFGVLRHEPRKAASHRSL